MARNFRALVAAGLLALFTTGAAAQSGCGGQGVSGAVCGNAGAATALPSLGTVTSLLDRAMGSAQGRVLQRGAGGWAASPNPSLGVNGSVGGAITLNGSSSGSVTLRVPAAAGGAIFQFPSTNGSAGFVLVTDGSGNTSWQASVAGGTVQSVGLSMPGIFSVSGSPVTLSGTLTATLATQAANLVWAGPGSGAAATPTFRALVGADLPNPSASTLGGVQSFAAVSSQWIRQISTSGVPTASQPNFTDIAGTVSAAQCPNPGPASLGCIQSLTSTASRWINSISTLGVPSTSQPAFTDISGSLSLAQFPSISNQSILGNNSGGTSIPSALSASQVLDFIGSTQGQVLYRNASAWVALSPGTSGQVLASGGPAANPAWTTVTGTGTVTTLTSGTGILFSSGATCTTTCTVSLNTIANNTVLANVSGGALAPSATTPTLILDIIGATQGNILYRAAGNWTVLAPGTNGQVLTMGATTPAWGSAGTVSTVSTSGILTGGPITTTGTLGVNATITPQGRVTLQSATPVMTTTQSAKTTIYYTPYAGNLIPIYNGTSMVPTAFSEISVATTDTAKNPSAIGASKINDWFVWSDGGTLRLSHGPDWTSDTARSAGTALTMVNGVLLNSVAITNACAIQRCTYVGTTRSNASSQLDWIIGGAGSGGVGAFLNVWNAYNRVLTSARSVDNGVTYTTNSLGRQARGSTANQINAVVGLQEDAFTASYVARGSTASSAGAAIGWGIGIDVLLLTTSIPFTTVAAAPMSAGAGIPYSDTFSIGYHFIAAMEFTDGTTATFDTAQNNTLSFMTRM